MLVSYIPLAISLTDCAVLLAVPVRKRDSFKAHESYDHTEQTSRKTQLARLRKTGALLRG